MTFAYSWSEEYATGIEMIDSQHKRLFQYLSDIDTAMKAHDEADMEVVVRSLLEYAVSHCTFEENLMLRAKYPYYEPHKHAHDKFRERAASYVKKLEDGADCYHLAREVRSEIAIWLCGHIGHDDQDYVPYVLAMESHGGMFQRALDRLFH